ncbi:DUF6388 family protein [Pantoea sp. 1.19]|uniref:DUF6388 family protein n=1 Tax=Pantoea sp. 1.19 TaxID=1925589 RepID=UPI000948EE16|nr:DUF6388 family protein [Pantoea sp. 1.19]
MKTPEAYYALAREMFITAYPEVSQALDALTDEEAGALGMTRQALRDWQAERAFAGFLREKKLDGMIFAIQLAEPDKAVAAVAIEGYLRERAAAMGMSWEAFCRENDL